MPSPYINNYYDLDRAKHAVALGQHRGFVGGMWDAIGLLQFNYVRQRGLTPDMRVLDVGCGPLRGGIHFVQYLEPAHYFGIDISQDLLDAGYDIELAERELTSKLPRSNLACNEDFDASDFNKSFDVAIAQSVFTHLPLNHIRLCLNRLAPVMKPDSKFYATFFLVPEGEDWTQPITHQRGGITSHPEKDPFHYRGQDLSIWLSDLPWQIEINGDWDHPRNQSMVTFTRKAS